MLSFKSMMTFLTRSWKKLLCFKMQCLAEILEINYCTATVVRLDLQDIEYLLQLIIDQEKVDAITTTENV